MDKGEHPDKKSSDAKIHRRISMAEKLNSAYDHGEKKNQKESNAERLRYILEEPGLRSLFREFLRTNFCEENLSFWLDVDDFKRKFGVTSSAVASSVRGAGIKGTPGQQAMERHHEALINTAFLIYHTYLAPSSQCELNIDHGLRNELSKYLEDAVTNLTGKSTFTGRIEPEQAAAFNATQLQTMIRLYERIQTHVFRLMATDSVPRVRVISSAPGCAIDTPLQFIKTPKFLAMRNWVDDFDPNDDDVRLLPTAPSQPPGLGGEEVGGAYITISQQGSERQQNLHRQEQQSGQGSGSPAPASP